MAAPNIVNVATVNGKTTPVIVANATGTFSVLSNAAASNQVLKINTILFSNYGAGNANVALNYYPAAALGGTLTPIANNITVPSGAVVVFIDKSSTLYLEENTSIGAQATVGNTISVFVSYELIA